MSERVSVWERERVGVRKRVNVWKRECRRDRVCWIESVLEGEGECGRERVWESKGEEEFGRESVGKLGRESVWERGGE